MINAIVAIDSKQGLATNDGIPWDLPADKTYFREKTSDSAVLMGYKTYNEFNEPLPNRQNLVLVRPNSVLREGFEVVEDVQSLIKQYHDSQPTLWVIGGAKLFAELLSRIQQIYITQVQGDFGCTKFFPDFKEKFEIVHQEPTQEENGIKFRFEVWRSSAA